jgi:hypothetical protein
VAEQDSTGAGSGLKQNWRPFLWLLIAVGLLAAIIWAATGGGQERQEQSPYTKYITTEGQIQSAVLEYAFNNSGLLPVLNASENEEWDIRVNFFGGGSVTARIIDLCTLMELGYLEQIPEGVGSFAGADNDNCDNGNGNCTCQSGAHYVWLVSMEGMVYSVCLGDGCMVGMEDGYENVWP